VKLAKNWNFVTALHNGKLKEINKMLKWKKILKNNFFNKN